MYKLTTYKAWDADSVLYYHEYENALIAGKEYFNKKVNELLDNSEWSIDEMYSFCSNMGGVEDECFLYSEKYDSLTVYVPDCLCEEPDLLFTIAPVKPMHFED